MSQGCDKTLRSVQYKTPIGIYEVEACDNGLHKIQPVLDPHKIKMDNSKSTSSVLKSSVGWLEKYFSTDKDKSDKLLEFPPICWTGLEKTEFETRVLKGALEHITFGQTKSYGELATIIHSPGASRAVGTSLKNNPIAILIPCHRIIRADGSFGNYAGGTRNDIKDWLIKYEKDA